MTQRPILLRSRIDAHVAAVVPAYNVASHIAAVLREMPPLVSSIIVVDDASNDDTALIVRGLAEIDRRIQLVQHEENGGVGAAMVTGFRRALECGADVVVKVDGDGQMPLWMLPKLIEPLLSGEADYTKGNRFRDFAALRRMPFLRRIGNVGLSFLAKAATGYWNLFDPTNGFVAVRADVVSQLQLLRIDPSYYFEISMLSNLYLLGAVVRDVPMAAQYGDEPSSLSIPRVLWQFPRKLLGSMIRRLTLKNFVYDFSLESVNFVIGLPLLLGGVAYGGYNWQWYVRHGMAAPTGTVVLPAMLIMLGVQLLISAMNLDLQAVPREPINSGPIPLRTTDPHSVVGQRGSE